MIQAAQGDDAGSHSDAEDDGWEGLFDDPLEAEAAGSGLGPAADAEGRASSHSGLLVRRTSYSSTRNRNCAL